MDLKTIRSRRSSAFWGGILPFMGYVLQSGVAVLFLFCLIAFAAWYTALVRNVPEGLPIRWIGLVLLAPFAAGGGFRTFLQPADIVFLLPQEARMKGYFAPAWRGSVIRKVVILALILVTLWPLYRVAESDPKPFGLTALLLAALLLLLSFGAWRELLMVSRPAAALYRLLRWVVGFLAVAAWLWHSAGSSLLFIAVLAAAYAAALWLPSRLSVPWELLISAEQTQAARAMAVLGWFVEVPGREQRTRTRRLLSGFGQRTPWEPGQAYRYLLSKSFIRSDMFMIAIRAAVVGALLVWLSGPGLLGGAVYLFFVLLLGVQLSELRRVHSESFWLSIYPLPAESRKRNAADLILRLQLGLAILMALAFIPVLLNGSGGIRPLLFLAGGMIIVLLQRAYAGRKSRLEEDED